jgi:integrase
MVAGFKKPTRRRRSSRIRIGRVSVFLHHGSWWLSHRQDGREMRQRVGPDQAAAERLAGELNAQLLTAVPSMMSFVPVGVPDLVRAFLDHHEGVLGSSIATVGRYRTALRHLVDYTSQKSERFRAHELDASGFVRFLRGRSVAPNGHPNSAPRPLTDKGRQFVLEVGRSLYRFAERRRHLPPYVPNPFADLPLDRFRIEDAKPIFVFDSETERQFLKACLPWEFTLHFTLAKTGLRPGEVCHLLVEELDLARGWLQVCNKPELAWSVKTRNERSVPLVGELRALLQALVGDRSAGVVFRRPKFCPTGADLDRAAMGKALRDLVAVRRREFGRELTRQENARVARQLWADCGAFDPDQIRRSFIRVANRTSLPNATCVKSWRHTFATLLQDANVDPLIRQITLGHKPTGAGGGLGMTAVYSHSRPATQAAEIQRAVRLWPESLQLAAERLSGPTTQ